MGVVAGIMVSVFIKVITHWRTVILLALEGHTSTNRLAMAPHLDFNLRCYTDVQIDLHPNECIMRLLLPESCCGGPYSSLLFIQRSL